MRLWADGADNSRIDSGVGGAAPLVLNGGGGRVGVGTTSPEGTLHVSAGPDATPTTGGFLILGATNGLNLGMDDNEIMARNAGAVAPLNLQADGGSVFIANNAGDGLLTIGDTVELDSSETGSDGAQLRLFDAAAVATFSELTPPRIGIATLKSLCSRTFRRTPRPSLPSTSTTLSAKSTPDIGSPSPSAA